MRRLLVQGFSCIDEASLELNRLTVLIGPQASGKSVLSKLVYFFYDLINDQFPLIQDGHEFKAFRDHVQTKFHDWFPVAAWGPKKFSIEFSSGEYHVRIRRGISKTGTGSLRISLPSFFEEQYNATLAILRDGIDRARRSEEPREEFELYFKVRESTRKVLRKRLGEDYVQHQLFVPAGRSFFTSIGKAVAAFEQSRILDPVTLSFGRFFASMMDHRLYPFQRGRRPRIPVSQLMEEIFGGELRTERDKQYVQTKDGRRIPFSALSSGQQELLPLLLALELWSDRSSGREGLIFIEEPEAHLFPSAQSTLIETLAALAMSEKNGSDLVMTTHSPYVLAKINNLVKAGELAERLAEPATDKLKAIIPRRSWIPPNRLAAYAIQDRKLVAVKDDTGLLDGEYLDLVSEEISREFSALQKIEVEHGKAC